MGNHIEQQIAQKIIETWGDDTTHPIWTIQEVGNKDFGSVKASIIQWRGVDLAVLAEIPFGSNVDVGLINLDIFGAQTIPDLSAFFPKIKDPTMRELAQECVGKLYAWYDGEIPDSFKFGRKPENPETFEGLLQECTVKVATVDKYLGDTSRSVTLWTVEIGRLLEAAKWKLRNADYQKGLKFRPKTERATTVRQEDAKKRKDKIARILDREIGKENFPCHASSGNINYSQLAAMVKEKSGLDVSSRTLVNAIKANLAKKK